MSQRCPKWDVAHSRRLQLSAWLLARIAGYICIRVRETKIRGSGGLPKYRCAIAVALRLIGNRAGLSVGYPSGEIHGVRTSRL
jgi:hypothetical protein